MILLSTLRNTLIEPPHLVIALSGGIDSLTLSAAAAEARGGTNLRLCHAVSPAVPEAATARVHAFAAKRNIPLDIVDSGEFSDPAYRSNPVDRCYYCKSNLYATITHMGDKVAAGTNLDDLGDYRPGLKAADEYGVLHPFVEAKMTKSDVRQLAKTLGLGDLAQLPAAPCLSSRIETGLYVLPEELAMIDVVETRLREELGNITLRCRRTKKGLAIELETGIFVKLDPVDIEGLETVVRQAIKQFDKNYLPLSFRPYRMGSAFIHE